MRWSWWFYLYIDNVVGNLCVVVEWCFVRKKNKKDEVGDLICKPCHYPVHYWRNRMDDYTFVSKKN